MIGGFLIEHLLKSGATIAGRRVVVNKLVRRETERDDEIFYDISKGYIDEAKLEGCDAVIHLAGESLMGPVGGPKAKTGWFSQFESAVEKWTPEKRAAIRDSRVKSTRLIAGALKSLKTPPSAFLCASGIGYYGTQSGDEKKGENYPPGTGFLAELSREIEQEASEAGSCCRVCPLRFGAVLGARGGMLKGMLPAFQMRVGGSLGSGKQWLSWISLHDAARAMLFLLENPSASGPVNLTSPNPVRNEDFTAALHEQLHPSAWFLLNVSTPAGILRHFVGDVADELMLASQRVIPDSLENLGFSFTHSNIDYALEWAIQDKAAV